MCQDFKPAPRSKLKWVLRLNIRVGQRCSTSQRLYEVEAVVRSTLGLAGNCCILHFSATSALSEGCLPVKQLEHDCNLNVRGKSCDGDGVFYVFVDRESFGGQATRGQQTRNAPSPATASFVSLCSLRQRSTF
jgi:hypothetical protein